MGETEGKSWLGNKIANLRYRFLRQAVFSQGDMEGRFTKTYELNYWGNEESRSGSGSTMAYTEGVRQALPDVIAKFGITSMLDAPCGDYYWMRVLRPQLPLDYIGGDIVRPLVEKNQSVYGDTRTRFIHFDITQDTFPDVDLWFCRDCLFHLSYADTRKALENFARSNVRYALFTTFPADPSFANKDIVTGDFRCIDLMAAPYDLPKDVQHRFDDYRKPDLKREMCMWTREQVAATLR